VLFTPFILGLPTCSTGIVSSHYTVSPCGTQPICTGTPAAAPLLNSDTDFGTIQYGDPFPSNWQRVFSFCQQAAEPEPSLTITETLTNGSTETIYYAYNLVNKVQTSLPSAAVTPLISPVQNATLNGTSLFSPATLDSRVLTLSWNKPAIGTPVGYRVLLTSVGQSTSGSLLVSTRGTFYTAQNSLTLPPELITSGVTYLVDITAIADAKANVETAPRRSALPTAAANVVSAPITISPSAP
jgi:hypothetical protein